MFYAMSLIYLIAVFRVTNFVYVDESGLNRYYRREMARAKRGTRVHGVKPGRRGSRTNIIAGLCGKKHFAVRSYEHSTTADFFEDWFEW
jgi:hypothetical protein